MAKVERFVIVTPFVEMLPRRIVLSRLRMSCLSVPRFIDFSNSI